MTYYFKALTEKVNTIKIVAAVDHTIEKAYNIAGKEHSYTETKTFYKNENMDAVYIATPHYLHKPMIKEALEEGKHVFCEKPVTTSIENAREIYSLDKKYSNLKIGFNYQYRYDYNCYNLAHGVNKGHLGKIYYANCNIFFSRNQKYLNEGPWRSTLKTSGGGTLLIHGSHIIDVMIWTLGKPISVMGRIDNLKFTDIEVEDIGFGIVEFKNGSYGQINDSMIIKPLKRRIGDRVELNIFGEKGSCFYEGPWPHSSIKWYGVEDFNIKDYIQDNSHISECVNAFANWILEDIPFFNTVEESSKVLCLIKALYKSSETGKKEKVEKL